MLNIEELEKIISEQEGVINDFYTEIGKVYFEMHADSCEPAFAALVSNIKESQAKIEECTNEIRTLKGLMLCPGCGLEIPEDTYTCSECGFKIKEEPLEEGMIRCAACGNAIREEVAFCYFCGTKVEKAPVVEETPVVEEASVVEAAPAIDVAPVIVAEPIVTEPQFAETAYEPAVETEVNVTKICTVCNNPLKPDVMFCTVCGTKVESPAPAVEYVPAVESAPVVESAPAVENNVSYCTSCNKPINPGSLFCTACGKRVEVNPVAPVASNFARPQAVPETKFCTNCGKTVDANAKFCTGCGFMIN